MVLVRYIAGSLKTQNHWISQIYPNPETDQLSGTPSRAPLTSEGHLNAVLQSILLNPTNLRTPSGPSLHSMQRSPCWAFDYVDGSHTLDQVPNEDSLRGLSPSGNPPGLAFSGLVTEFIPSTIQQQAPVLLWPMEIQSVKWLANVRPVSGQCQTIAPYPVQYSTALYNTVRHCTIQYSTVQYSTWIYRRLSILHTLPFLSIVVQLKEVQLFTWSVIIWYLHYYDTSLFSLK